MVFHHSSTPPSVALAGAPAAPKSKAKPPAKPKVETAVQEAKQTVEVEIGTLVDGVVTGVTGRGVLVNIGQPKPGILEVPAELRAEFQVGDKVKGMRVEKVDPVKKSVMLSMEDPELELDDELYTPPPASAKKTRAKTPARPKPATKAKAAPAKKESP